LCRGRRWRRQRRRWRDRRRRPGRRRLNRRRCGGRLRPRWNRRRHSHLFFEVTQPLAQLVDRRLLLLDEFLDEAEARPHTGQPHQADDWQDERNRSEQEQEHFHASGTSARRRRRDSEADVLCPLVREMTIAVSPAVYVAAEPAKSFSRDVELERNAASQARRFTNSTEEWRLMGLATFLLLVSRWCAASSSLRSARWQQRSA